MKSIHLTEQMNRSAVVHNIYIPEFKLACYRPGGRVDGSCCGCYKISFRVGSVKPTVVLVMCDRRAVEVMCDREAVNALGKGAGWLPTGWFRSGRGHT
jgi:hypothetical protein